MPCCGGARVWVRSLSPTPTRRPSFRGVVLKSVLTQCSPAGSSWGSGGCAAQVQRKGVQWPLGQVVRSSAPEFPLGHCTGRVVRTTLVYPLELLGAGNRSKAQYRP